MKYAYSNAGNTALRWGMSAPRGSRASDTVALGSLGDPTLVLPRPGAPEPINDSYRFLKGGGAYVLDTKGLAGLGCGGGCGCSGGCGHKDGMHGIQDLPAMALSAVSAPGSTVVQMLTGTYPQRPIGVAVTGALAFLAYKLYKRSKR